LSAHSNPNTHCDTYTCTDSHSHTYCYFDANCYTHTDSNGRAQDDSYSEAAPHSTAAAKLIVVMVGPERPGAPKRDRCSRLAAWHARAAPSRVLKRSQDGTNSQRHSDTAPQLQAGVGARWFIKVTIALLLNG